TAAGSAPAGSVAGDAASVASGAAAAAAGTAASGTAAPPAATSTVASSSTAAENLQPAPPTDMTAVVPPVADTTPPTLDVQVLGSAPTEPPTAAPAPTGAISVGS
ncbi:MAG: hypothetical protein HOQ13_06595, partial [Dermatophilaceae bacterium]|nr:hypothetical protein [Dermatophilaceae bacterium]